MVLSGGDLSESRADISLGIDVPAILQIGFDGFVVAFSNQIVSVSANRGD